MRLRHIEVIQATLQSGDLGAAAEQLQLTVEATDHLLNDVERELGFLLFARVRGKLQPTPEARELQGGIEQLYAGLDKLRQQASALRQHQDPPLRVVSTATLGQHLLPQSLAALRRRYRETPCHLASANTQAIVRSLLLHESQVGFSLHAPEHPSLHQQALAQGKLQLLAPHGWLQPRQKYVGVQELAGQAMVGLDGEDPLSAALDARLTALRPVPIVQTRVQTYQMMRSMVEAGEGLAIVDPFTALGAKAAGLDVCPLAPAVPITLYALTLKEHSPSSALRALLEIVAEHAKVMLG
ncbi:LysR substrate-binding domain-containing protein [Pseudomonas sp. HR96]|uniref:LysR family transcriptional regulator n=1 Tax=Pseudomonas sp. HR96 TaxID=1027966 RepID=UPI002A74768C|nr:LysR substrate-binding domain-containing protein [Pseudomonas sp. HR96]WPP01484.1 LysR substrate-binding domain-containing protein [Pseudomonas sp. HR96]